MVKSIGHMCLVHASNVHARSNQVQFKDLRIDWIRPSGKERNNATIRANVLPTTISPSAFTTSLH